jgi:AcrR family transcriptional regulator
VGKGLQTREHIVDKALSVATQYGLDGLSIGGLASELGLSKSGLFAHFGSKEELQLQVLKAAATRFAEHVMRPAFVQPRGEPRVRALFENWLAWANDSSLPGGCLFVAAATELDDKPGPPRDYLVEAQREWLGALAKAALLAMSEGHFRADLDADQFAFELNALTYGFNFSKRLLQDPNAEARARAGFERLIADARA